MKDVIDKLNNLDKFWSENTQHFVLGIEAGLAVGLVVFIGLMLMGKIKFN